MSAPHALTIALAGNPNCGKSTVFNALTGSRQEIGNWPGVTVEKKEGQFEVAPSTPLGPVDRLLARPFDRGDRGEGPTIPPTQPNPSPASAESPVPKSVSRQSSPPGGRPHDGVTTVRVVDLPGIYSLAASSEDEAVARNYLLSGETDVVVNVIDATNIQRNLFLTLQLIEMGLPVVIVLNMMDLATEKGLRIDAADLSRHLDCPVLPVSATDPTDAQRLREAVVNSMATINPSSVHVDYGEAMEEAIRALSQEVAALSGELRATPRWIALKTLEGDAWVRRRVRSEAPSADALVDQLIAQCERQTGEDLDVAIADAKYGFIHGLSRHIARERLTRETLTERLDRVVMNRFAALPVFALVMYAVFWLTMSFGGAFIDFFDILFGTLLVDGFGSLLASAGASPQLIAILAGGIGGGVQTVATFIPIIFTMFFALSILEDSGYMARAAYVMDRFMRAIGLPGKSFVPMMVGFGCTVPAIMGTRTLESTRDRYTTIFMAPFMSCGARLPVYALFASALFPERPGLVVLSLYLVGIIVAVLTGVLLRRTLFRGKASHFVMELPPYHAPRLRFVFTDAWRRLKAFIVRAGFTIVVVVTILSTINTFGTDGSVGHEGEADSVLSAIGKAAGPLFEPMGIERGNWPATVGIFTGILAKEAVVGTLSSIYGQSGAEQDDTADIAAGLRQAFLSIPANLAAIIGIDSAPAGADAVETGAPTAEPDTSEGESRVFARLRARFARASAYAYLLFILLYFPCVAALGAAIREMGTGYGVLLALYTTLLAWSTATLFYQFVSGPAPSAVIAALAVLVFLVVLFRIIGTSKLGKSRLDQER